MVVTIFAMAMLGFLLSVSVVRCRMAWALGNLLEYPGWLLCGFLVPVTILPVWVRPISYALAPTWGMAAIRESAAGGTGWPEVAICAALGLGYGLIGASLSEAILRSAGRHATVSLT